MAATGALATRWPGTAELEVVTGTTPGEAFVSVTPAWPGPPRLPEVGTTGLVVRRRSGAPPGAVHAEVRGRTYRISAGVFWQVHAGAAAALLARGPRP